MGCRRRAGRRAVQEQDGESGPSIICLRGSRHRHLGSIFEPISNLLSPLSLHSALPPSLRRSSPFFLPPLLARSLDGWSMVNRSHEARRSEGKSDNDVIWDGRFHLGGALPVWNLPRLLDHECFLKYIASFGSDNKSTLMRYKM